MWKFKRSRSNPAEPKKDRFGDAMFQVFGPATVEGAIQGWSPEAKAQYKRMRENFKRTASS
ncbi:hypothetical protein [Dactylosporangium sp. NPDC005555]|uniref:hypothetical protein n=1 Tax=Dactylosporangium sp. NPDC005555 TaxID=3154889 RepID=UPI0033A27253